VAKLVETTAGRSWGVMPTATARENSTGLDDGTAEEQVDDEDRDAEDDAHAGQQHGEAGEAALELGLRVPFAETDGDLTELCARASGDDDCVCRSLVHDGAHEEARGELGERCPGRHRGR
jgi:hypothetical protein